MFGKSPAMLGVELWHDQMVYGMSVCIETRRPWWNPKRWICGEIKLRRVDPATVYMEVKK